MSGFPLRPAQRFERSAVRQAELPVPVGTVWAVLADLPAMPTWHPGVTRLTLGGELGRGVAMRLYTPWPGNAWVGRLEPPHRLELLYFPDGLGLRAETAFTLEALGPDRARLTVELRLSGGPAPLLWPTLGRRAERVLAGLERCALAAAV